VTNVEDGNLLGPNVVKDQIGIASKRDNADIRLISDMS
jgi:hypothetical protein